VTARSFGQRPVRGRAADAQARSPGREFCCTFEWVRRIGGMASGNLNMTQADSNMSRWLADLAAGEPLAEQRLFDTYFERAVRLARSNLRRSRRRMADEEDVAVGALGSFLRGAATGRFPDVRNSDDLWRLLATITIRKAAAQVRSEKRRKRGEGEVRGDSVFLGGADGSDAVGFDGTEGADPTPELVAMMSENCRALLDRLDDSTLRTVAICKLQGFTHKEIARKIGRVEETVNRKVRRIREIWMGGEME